MSVTLRETLQAALELIQVYGAGEKLGQADAVRGVAVANGILEEWSLDSLACYAMRELTVSLKANKSVYTYGPAQTTEKLEDVYKLPGINIFGTGLVTLGPSSFIPPTQGVLNRLNFIVAQTQGLSSYPILNSNFYNGYPEFSIGTLVHLQRSYWVSGREPAAEDVIVKVTGAPTVPPKPFVAPDGDILVVTYPVEWVSGSSNTIIGTWQQAKYLFQYIDVYQDYPTRPTGLMGGPNSAYVTDGNGTRYPVQLVDLGTWNQIANTKIIKSNIPTTAYYRANFPVSEVWLYPTPTDETYTFTIQAYNSFDVEKLDDGLDLPPGYAKALLYALGKELWPFYRAGDLPAAVQVGASESLAAIQRMNKQDLQAGFDKQLLRRPNLTYNIYKDNTR